MFVFSSKSQPERQPACYRHQTVQFQQLEQSKRRRQFKHHHHRRRRRRQIQRQPESDTHHPQLPEGHQHVRVGHISSQELDLSSGHTLSISFVVLLQF